MSQETTFEPLNWGHGPHIFELFLEPTCPFSVKAFNKIDALLEQAGEENITVKIRLHSQPWHMYSGVLVRCILAASLQPNGGKQAAWQVMQAIADHRDEFEFDHHCKGPNMNTTPAQLIARLEDYSGIKLAELFEHPDLEAAIKWHTKYARQNGIHVSPTFMIDGLVAPALGSGDEVSSWVEAILG